MCVMCRDHAKIGTEANVASRGLEEEMEFGSGDKSQDAARLTDEGRSPQTTTRGLLKKVAAPWAELDISTLSTKERSMSRTKSSPAELPIPRQPAQAHTNRKFVERTLAFLKPIPNDRFAGHDSHAPFTDSGYASGPIEATTAVGQSHHPLQVPEDPDDSNITAQRSIIEEDAKTLYSAATSLDPVCSRQYIQELSRDLYRNLQAQSIPPDWSSIFQVLPDLIKTFATKIGQGGDSHVHLDIMYFIHKRHRWVASKMLLVRCIFELS